MLKTITDKIDLQFSLLPYRNSGVNDKPDVGFSFCCGQTNEIRNKNIWEPVVQNVIILGFLMAVVLYIYIFGEICHIFTLYSGKIMFSQLIMYHKRHFPFLN